jgi:hypothetical protein
MSHVIVRPGRFSDHQTMREWFASVPDQNLFDPDVLDHESTFTLCAFDDSGPLVYVPVQRPLMMESLAIRPGLDNRRIALSLAELTRSTILRAYDLDAPEVYFLCENEQTLQYATRHLFKEVSYPLRRVNLRELEG